MPLRSIFGPVDADYSRRYLGPLRASGECRTLGYAPGEGIDLVVAPGDSWQAVARQLGGEWAPDLVALYLPYAALPAFATEANVPVVGLAADWNLLWTTYLQTLPLCDLVLTDTTGVAVLRRAGLTHVEQAMLFGGSDTWLPATSPETPRDIDVLFVGNVNPAVTRGRLALLDEVAALADCHTVVIDCGIPFDEYRALLQRTRIVFNPSARREWNQRVCEAVLCGALLAIEADNLEVLETLRPGQECVTFAPGNISIVLREVLADEPRRLALARAARERVGDPTFARYWRETVARLETRLDDLRQRRASRPPTAPRTLHRARVAASLSATAPDPALLEEATLTRALSPRTATAADINDLALLLLQAAQAGAVSEPINPVEQAVRLLALRPGHPVLGYNLCWLLFALEQHQHARNLVRTTLRALDTAPLDHADLWDVALSPGPYEEVRVEWQRAGWLHPNDLIAQRAARREVLRWRLLLWLGDRDPQAGVVPFYEAHAARSDLAHGRAALGCKLCRDGHQETALPHLREAVASNPLDANTVRALAQALHDTGRAEERRELEVRRRLWHRVAPRFVRREDWFLQPEPVTAPTPLPTPSTNGVVPVRPSGKELASLIILCHNQLEFTRACLESVLRFTRSPYELILVDNASTDDTPAFLAELQTRPGPQRVEILTNTENRGFGAGCNQGIAAAQGRYLVFLNNDTLVTPGWLDGLVRLSLHDWPRIGLTGALSNAATPEQTVACDYPDINGLLAFARARTTRFAGQARELDRLSGFCLLARREVLDQIGTFDERFGLGFFEDDDLCLRARRAGYRLLVALDVFVHHYGSQTVHALGIDAEGQLRANLTRFVDKWGTQTPAGYLGARLTPLGSTTPTAPQQTSNDFLGGFVVDVSAVPTVSVSVPATPRTPSANVSLCIIARNEEYNIADCIGPVRHLFGEVIVNDTGSTDRTVGIARGLGAQVLENPWQDSFAQARNQSLEAARGEWIFWLDADDRVDAANARRLAQLFATLPATLTGYALTCRCTSAEGGDTDVSHVRLFPRHAEVRWSHRIHEQILPALRALGCAVCFRHDIVIRHVGYSDAALRGRKLDRDLRLLEMERQELGEHPFTLFNLGCIHLERANYLEAFGLFQASLQRSHPGDSIVRKLHAQVARCQWELAQRPAALWHCNAGLQHYPQDEELLFLAAQYNQESENLEPARRLYHQLLEGPRDAEHFGSTATGLRGYRAMNNLALVYQRLGNAAEAERWFRAALADHPGFLTGWLALAHHLAAQGRRADVEDIARHLESTGCPEGAARVRQRLLQAG